MSESSKKAGQIEYKKEIVSISIDEVWAGHELLGRVSVSQVLKQHFSRTVKNLKSSWFLTFVSGLTAFMSLLLLTFFAVLLLNINTFLTTVGKSHNVSVFLQEAISDADLQNVNRVIESRDFISGADFVSKEQALELFKKTLGSDSELLLSLKQENPLPASYELKIQAVNLDTSAFDRFITELKGLSGVEQVVYSSALLKEFSSVFVFVQGTGLVSALLMLFITTLIVGNTVSLAIYSHRDEIRIMKLLGASPAYIKAPFIMEGILIGILGGIAAVLVSVGLFNFIASSWPQTLLSDGMFAAPQFISLTSQIVVMFLGGLVGFIGAYIGARACSSV